MAVVLYACTHQLFYQSWCIRKLFRLIIARVYEGVAAWPDIAPSHYACANQWYHSNNSEFAWLLCELLKYRSRLSQWIKFHRRLQGYQTRWATFKKKDSCYKATVSLNSTRSLNSFSRRLIVARSWFESAWSFSFASDNASCELSTS